MEIDKKPSNPRMNNLDGMYASDALREDFFSLRDNFAGLAMQSLIKKIELTQDQVLYSDEIHKLIPVLSYQIADEMLKQREP